MPSKNRYCRRSGYELDYNFAKMIREEMTQEGMELGAQETKERQVRKGPAARTGLRPYSP
jgi:hypothetical protein